MFALVSCAQTKTVGRHQNRRAVSKTDEILFYRAWSLRCADGASDEQLASKLLTGERSMGGQLEPLFPGVVIRAWDKAHGIRRILSKGIEADAMLHVVTQRLIFGQDAIVHQVEA